MQRTNDGRRSLTGGRPSRTNEWEISKLTSGRFRPIAWFAFVMIGISIQVSRTASADRILLAPSGLITTPNHVAVESLTHIELSPDSIFRLRVGIPDSLILGLEVEAERRWDSGTARTGYNLQYSFTGNATADLAAAFSVGVRDVGRQGLDNRAAYFAAARTITMPRAIEGFLPKVRVSAGYGSGSLGGFFVGGEIKTALGLRLRAEIEARKLNVGAMLDIGRYFHADVQLLRDRVYAGAGFNIGWR